MFGSLLSAVLGSEAVDIPTFRLLRYGYQPSQKRLLSPMSLQVRDQNRPIKLFFGPMSPFKDPFKGNLGVS